MTINTELANTETFISVNPKTKGNGTMRKHLTTLLGAALILSLTLTPAAFAKISVNGINLNGLSPNGIAFNGIGFNGIAFNGIALNGIAFNGVRTQGVMLNGMAKKGEVKEHPVTLSTPSTHQLSRPNKAFNFDKMTVQSWRIQ